MDSSPRVITRGRPRSRRTRTLRAKPLRGRTRKGVASKGQGSYRVSPGLSSCPYAPKCVEVEFSEVRRSKRPAKRGSVPSRAAWQHHFGAETPRPSSVRCSVVYQGVATRNAPTTREILAHRSGTKRRSRNGHLAEVDMVTWQRRGSLRSLRVMGITALGRSSLFSPLPFYRAARSPCWLAGGPGRLERGYAELLRTPFGRSSRNNPSTHSAE